MKLRLLPGSGTPRAASGFAERVLPHLDSAHNLARWLVRDPALAEDVVQEAMLRALTYFASLRDDDARAWLLRIVRNTAYGALAARGRRAETSLEGEAGPVIDPADPSDDPEAALGRVQDLGCLEARLAKLPAELRECIVLRELEELSYKEVARITGVPIGTVMSRLWRARQALMADAAEERGA